MKSDILIYKNYPDGMKDSEILACIREYTGAMVEHGARPDVVTQFAPIIQMGHYELEKRQVKRVTRISIVMSGVSMLVAGVALFIAVENSHTSNTWKKEQIILLNDIKAEIVKSNASAIIKKPANKALKRDAETRRAP